MLHETLERNEDVQGSSNRAFGFVFAVVFAIIAVAPLFLGGHVRWWSAAIGAGFTALAIVYPAALAPLNRLWTRFGLMLHAVVNPVILGIMFFGVLTPTGLLMRLFGKDPLRLKRESGAATYWIERSPPGPLPESLRDQF